MSMVTVTLRSTLIFGGGERLGPGEVQMDEKRARSLGLLKGVGKAGAASAASAAPKKRGRKPKTVEAPEPPAAADEG